MKRLLFPLLIAISFPNSVNAELDTEVHKLCLQAADYVGCLKAQTKNKKIIAGEISENGESLIVNSCPEGNAYVGNGLCKKVECEYPMDHFKAAKGHDQIVAGKSDWSCKKKFLRGVGLLTLGSEFTKAKVNKICPNSEPEIGWKNSCEKVISKPTLITKKNINSSIEPKENSDLKLSIQNQNPSLVDIKVPLLEEKVPLGKKFGLGNFIYDTYEDTASGKTVFTNWLISVNEINLSFPYSGSQNGILTIRNHPRFGEDIIFRIEKGQILSLDGISLDDNKYFLVRFDNGEVERWNYSESTSQSSDIIFIGKREEFLKKLLDSEKIYITVNLYQEGQKTFIFDVSLKKSETNIEKKSKKLIISKKNAIKHCRNFQNISKDKYFNQTYIECMEQYGYDPSFEK